MITKEEKKALGSIIISIVALALLFFGLKIVAVLVSVLSLILISNNKQKISPLFLFGSVFCGAVAGFTIDHPITSYPPTFVCLTLFPQILNSRLFFFKKVGIHSLIWLDLTLGLANLVVFILTAFAKGYDLFNWIAATIPALLFSFFSIMIYLDRLSANKKSQNLSATVGMNAPEFILPDQNGKIVSLRELLASGNHVLLIFVRGHWCPSCHIMLRGYVKNKEILNQKEIKIVGIGPDPEGVNKEIMNRIDENSILLSDTEQETAFRYMSAIQENHAITKSLYKKGIPLPASFLIHKNGKIIFTSRSDKAGEILHPNKIFEALKGL